MLLSNIIRSESLPMFQRTIEITFGFLFGFLTFEFNLGKEYSIEEMMKEFKTEVYEKGENNEWK